LCCLWAKCPQTNLDLQKRHSSIAAALAVIEKKDFSNKESSIIFVEKELE
jgi:hypothetical protein